MSIDELIKQDEKKIKLGNKEIIFNNSNEMTKALTRYANEFARKIASSNSEYVILFRNEAKDNIEKFEVNTSLVTSKNIDIETAYNNKEYGKLIELISFFLIFDYKEGENNKKNIINDFEEVQAKYYKIKNSSKIISNLISLDFGGEVKCMYKTANLIEFLKGNDENLKFHSSEFSKNNINSIMTQLILEGKCEITVLDNLTETSYDYIFTLTKSGTKQSVYNYIKNEFLTYITRYITENSVQNQSENPLKFSIGSGYIISTNYVDNDKDKKAIDFYDKLVDEYIKLLLEEAKKLDTVELIDDPEFKKGYAVTKNLNNKQFKEHRDILTSDSIFLLNTDYLKEKLGINSITYDDISSTGLAISRLSKQNFKSGKQFKDWLNGWLFDPIQFYNSINNKPSSREHSFFFLDQDYSNVITLGSFEDFEKIYKYNNNFTSLLAKLFFSLFFIEENKNKNGTFTIEKNNKITFTRVVILDEYDNVIFDLNNNFEENTIESIKDLYDTFVYIVKLRISKELEELKKDKNDENNSNVLEEIQEIINQTVGKKNKKYEKDFFYIDTNGNNKKIPNNTFVDIEFKVPHMNDNGSFTPRWLPVTSIYKSASAPEAKIGESEVLYPSNYFNSFEITDDGGSKKITLTLKSPDDMNLENIITSSLKESTYNINDTNDSNLIDSILKSSNSNFRIRFGYRDQFPSENKEYYIIENENYSSNFMNRTILHDDEAKKVLQYPWAYFKITDLSFDIINNENIYTITGVDSGSYILDNMCLCGINTNFVNDIDNTDTEKGLVVGSPRNVIGHIAKWIKDASEKNNSTPNIYILGQNSGEIISGVKYDDNEIFTLVEEEYELKDEKSIYFNPSSLLKMEDRFFSSAGNTNRVEKYRNFNLKNNKNNLYVTVKELLTKLVNWLPQNYYYILDNEEDTCAIHLPYDQLDAAFNQLKDIPTKCENMSYQILEAEAKLKSSNEYKKTYFIRLYFNGPSDDDNNKDDNVPYLRVYNYKYFKDSVVSEVNISSSDNNAGLDFGNIASSITVSGGGVTYTFVNDNKKGTITDSESLQTNNGSNIYDKESGKINTNAMIDAIINQRYSQGSQDSPYFTMKGIVLNNTTLQKNSDDQDADNAAIYYALRQSAANYFTSLSNQAYKGNVTIAGDPFYYFDASMQPGVYEIYLNLNRIKDLKTAKHFSSYLSGIYHLLKITHKFNEKGEFTTTLDIAKRVFTPANESIDNLNQKK